MTSIFRILSLFPNFIYTHLNNTFSSFLLELELHYHELLYQGSYRQDCVKFKDFSRTSLDYPTVFKDLKFIKKS